MGLMMNFKDKLTDKEKLNIYLVWLNLIMKKLLNMLILKNWKKKTGNNIFIIANNTP